MRRWERQAFLIERAYLEVLTNLPEQHALGPEEQHLILEPLLEIDRHLG